MAAQEVERDAPKEINFESLVVDVCFHPAKDVIAAGEMEGVVSVFSYSLSEENHELMTLNHHKKAVRAVQFSPDGSRLFTVSKDKSLQAVDMESGANVCNIKKAHDTAIYSLLVIDSNLVATGDDDGRIKLWDTRKHDPIMDLKHNEEFISDMYVDEKKKILLATSGDGTLTAFNIRKHKMEMQSELFDSELLSLAVVKGGEKVVCGTGEGIMNIFNYGEWGNISDRFPGHPLSIDCMVKVNEDIVCTGSIDGIIRAVNILPNRFLGVVGEHDDFPVENLSLSHCGHFLASCSHDQKIKFWNIDDVGKQKVDTRKKARKTNNKSKKLNKAAAKNDFFADLADDGGQTEDKAESGDSDSDSDDSDDSEEDET